MVLVLKAGGVPFLHFAAEGWEWKTLRSCQATSNEETEVTLYWYVVARISGLGTRCMHRTRGTLCTEQYLLSLLLDIGSNLSASCSGDCPKSTYIAVPQESVPRIGGTLLYASRWTGEAASSGAIYVPPHQSYGLHRAHLPSIARATAYYSSSDVQVDLVSNGRMPSRCFTATQTWRSETTKSSQPVHNALCIKPQLDPMCKPWN